MLRKTLLAVAVAGALCSMPFAYAEHQCKSPMCFCKEDKAKMYNKLNLDAAQREKMKSMREEMHTMMKSNREQMRAIRKQMRDLMTSENLDQSMVDKLVTEKAELMKSMTKMRIIYANKMYNMLNPQQKEMFKKMMNNMQAHGMMNGMHHGKMMMQNQ